MSSSDEPFIERCPTCGSKAHETNLIASIAVECDDCGEVGPSFAIERKHNGKWPGDAAISAWNKWARKRKKENGN